MAFGREDVSVARSDGSADVFGLAGFLRDNNLISHNGSFGIAATTPIEHTENSASSQVARRTAPPHAWGASPQKIRRQFSVS
jgi:hypothetical protein